VQLWYRKEFSAKCNYKSKGILNSKDICRKIQCLVWFCGWDGSMTCLQRTLRYFDLRQQDMIVRPKNTASKKYRTSKLEMAGLVWDHSIKSVLLTCTEKNLIFLRNIPEKSYIHCHVAHQNALLDKFLLLALPLSTVMCSPLAMLWSTGKARTKCKSSKFKLWEFKGRCDKRKNMINEKSSDKSHLPFKLDFHFFASSFSSFSLFFWIWSNSQFGI